MITSASDYKHVTGDLNLIQIDGGIMPLRTGNTGKYYADGSPIPRSAIMRGEDIAFLLEALGERNDAESFYSYQNYPSSFDKVDPGFVYTFSRKLKRPTQLACGSFTLYSGLKSFFTRGDQRYNFLQYKHWVKNNTFLTKVYNMGSSNPSDEPSPVDAYPNNYVTSADWPLSDSVTSDLDLRKSTVSGLFSAVAMLRSFQAQYSTTGNTFNDPAPFYITYEATTENLADGTTTSRQHTTTVARTMIMNDYCSADSSSRYYYKYFGPGLARNFRYWHPWCTPDSGTPHLALFKVKYRLGSQTTYYFVFMNLSLPASAESIASTVLSAVNRQPLDHTQSGETYIELHSFYRYLTLKDHTKWS